MERLSSPWAAWLLLVLALYGFAGLCARTVRLVQRFLRRTGTAPVSVVVLVRNQESQVEDLVRSLTGRLRGSTAAAGLKDWVWLDLASTDGTPEILERLCRSDSGMRLVRLPPEQVSSAYEIAHFLGQSSVVVLVDLCGQVDGATVLTAMESIW